MILFSRGLSKMDSNRLEWLRCALMKLQKHLHKTPVDVYIWTMNSTASPIVIPSWLTPEAFPRVNIITIPEDTWKVPCGLKPDSQWAARRHFEVDYYLMGRWRLAFSPDFAKEMGYEYHLQFDDDAILLQEYPENIVEHMNSKQMEMAVNGDILGEVAHLVIGLPELTYYWMRVNNYSPQGILLKRVRGGDMWSFLNGGWDRYYHPGFFIIISMTWWFRSEIQDYLNTVMRLGRDIEGRWQEQEVMNMMRLVFIPEDKVWVMKDLDIGHDRHKRGNFEKWCG
ncbi:hypothetical protein EON65_45595 [archaeon]|nr:MAG: hypothetical protein EON65_45595 [archaeon]